MMLEFETRKIIESSNWDKFVSKTYGKPYCFQQQEGYRDRGTYEFTVPGQFEDEFYGTVSLAEWVNGEIDSKPSIKIRLHWYRDFYPDYIKIARDLHHRGLIESGTYHIEVE